MKLIFSNNNSIDLGIQNTELCNVYKKIYKNLCHAELMFREWDNPYYTDSLTYEQLVDRLESYAQIVSVKIDKVRCLAREKLYFNEIHKIYELNYNGHPEWLDFHEHIHLCEHYYNRLKILDIDYREKAGMLERPFDLAWLKDSTVEIKAGDVFVSWAELGKIPYSYWNNDEPDDFNRLCQLSKPWLKLRPKIKIALEDFNDLTNKPLEEFKAWWSKYEEDWCRHWNLKSWSVTDMFSNAILGRIEDINTVKSLLQNNINPIRVSML